MRLLLAAAVLVLAAGPVLAQRPAPAHVFAQPSDIVATEIAQARAAREKGPAAYRQFAAPGAETFAPQPVRVTALPDRPLPARNARRIWISCDGSYALSYGAAGAGWYATIWQRQKKGQYRFVLDQAGPLSAPLPDVDMIDAHAADCPVRAHRPDDAPSPATVRDEIDAGRLTDEDAPTAKPKKRKDPGPPDPNAADAAAALTADWTHGESRDHTLAWATSVAPGGARTLVVRVKNAGQWAEVLRATAP